MGLAHSPRIVTDNLVLALDAANTKSYPGSGTNVSDLSGNGYDFTMTNGATTNATNGGVFSFDGSDDYLNTTSIPSSFWNSGSWTVSLWAYFDAVDKGSDNSMIGHGTNTQNQGLHLTERSQRVYFGFYSNDFNTGQILNATTWYNIVWTFNYSTKAKRVFVNTNDEGGDGTTGYSGTSNDTRIGNVTYSAVGDMDGFLSNIMFYNKVLTDTEIKQNFNALRGRYGI